MSKRWAFLVNAIAASPWLDRARRGRLLRAAGMRVHPTASVYPGVYFHTSEIDVGEHAILNHGVHIDNTAEVTIGARTGLGLQASVITQTHAAGTPWRRYGEFQYAPVKIGTGCWIGARSTILAGVEVGDGCVIGAGALVRTDCEPNCLYAGVPARLIRRLSAT